MEETGCPWLYWDGELNSWIAFDKDPCPTKECGNCQCHNYNKPFSEPNFVKQWRC